MLFEAVGDNTVVVAHSPGPVDDGDWERFLALTGRIVDDKGSVNVMVRSEGSGGPNGLQRAKLEAVAERGLLRVGVLTRSRVIRGIVTALSWIQKIDIKAFDPEDEAGLGAHLSLSDADRASLMAVLRRLETEANQAEVVAS